MKTNEAILVFSRGDEYLFLSLIQTLVELEYERVEMVLESGDFAVRGSIIDIFPGNHDQPIRLEFFENQLERISAFDVHTQLSFSQLEATQIAPYSKALAATRVLISKTPGDAHVISQLQIGDYVVHQLHGIGIYQGLKH